MRGSVLRARRRIQAICWGPTRHMRVLRLLLKNLQVFRASSRAQEWRFKSTQQLRGRIHHTPHPTHVTAPVCVNTASCLRASSNAPTGSQKPLNVNSTFE